MLPREALLERLEDLVDHSSLATVVDVLGEIGYLKEEHISYNWQDLRLAKRWQKAGARLTTLAVQIRELDI